MKCRIVYLLEEYYVCRAIFVLWFMTCCLVASKIVSYQTAGRIRRFGRVMANGRSPQIYSLWIPLLSFHSSYSTLSHSPTVQCVRIHGTPFFLRLTDMPYPVKTGGFMVRSEVRVRRSLFLSKILNFEQHRPFNQVTTTPKPFCSSTMRVL